MAIRLNPSRRSSSSSSTSSSRSSSSSEVDSIRRDLRSGDPRRVLRAQAQLARLQGRATIEEARRRGGGATRAEEAPQETPIETGDAVASTVGPSGEPAVIRATSQGGFSTVFQGGPGEGTATQFSVQTVGGRPDINPRTGRPYGSVQPSSLTERGPVSSAFGGAGSVFTNPQEAGRVLRNPVVAGPNAPPALQAAAREDRAASVGALPTLLASLSPLQSGSRIVAGATPILRSRVIPTVAPLTLRYVAPRSTAAAIGTGLLEGGAITFAGVRAAQTAVERTLPSFEGASSSQVASAFRSGQSEVIERGTGVGGFAARLATPFASGRATQEATFNRLIAQGVSPSEAERAARTVTTRSRVAVGGTEIGLQLGIGKTSELLGGQFIANRFALLARRGTTVPNTLLGRSSQVVGPIAGAGTFEGAGSTIVSTTSRTGERPSFGQVAAGGFFGAIIAGPLGGLIAAPRSAAGRSLVEIPANVLDPFEAPGDIAARGAEARIIRGGGRVRTPSFVEQNGRTSFAVSEISGTQQLTTRVSPPVLTVTPSFTPVSSRPSAFTSTPTSTRTSPSTIISTRTTSATTTPVSSIASVPVSPIVPVSTRTTVPATTRTTVPVPVVTPRIGLPVIPPAGGLGGGFGIPVGGRRDRKGYAPSVAAVVFGIKGKGRGGGFSGLELRPIASSPVRSNFARFA